MTRIVVVRGKWQKRVVYTLAEANHSLTIRQLRIRCGMTKDSSGDKMRSLLYYLAKKGILQRVQHGHYLLAEEK